MVGMVCVCPTFAWELFEMGHGGQMSISMAFGGCLFDLASPRRGRVRSKGTCLHNFCTQALRFCNSIRACTVQILTSSNSREIQLSLPPREGASSY